ncbi:hypothetical protein [Pseudonocardia sp. ICBG1293]|uniref:hypothetical protein n=1 Tax=Pseudonocardia sp. ICBG1293 TaxID=2844382 RepID=UPI001CCA23FF|nr:hypothetical protein [Pseudonocardia sp. ICBG1293]
MVTRDSSSRTAIWSLGRKWIPTALGSSLLAWEIPVVVAIVARTSDGPTAVAAFGAGLSVLVVVNAPALALAPLVVLTMSKHGSRTLWKYAFAVGLFGTALIVLLALTPLTTNALGIPTELHGPLSICLLSFGLAPLAVALRRCQHGHLISSGRTSVIAHATILRMLGTVAAVVALWQAGLPSAAVGGLALTVGAWIEVTRLGWTVRRSATSPRPESEVWPGSENLFATHLRLSSTVALNMLPALATTVLIARAVDAETALIIWPVLYALVSLITVPLSDLEVVGSSHLTSGGDSTTVFGLTVMIAASLVILGAVTVASPVIHFYLTVANGLSQQLTETAYPWVVVLAAIPPLWAVRGYVRSLVLASGWTKFLVYSASMHIGGMTVSGCVLLTAGLPGLASAAFAMLTAIVAEIAFMYYLVVRRQRRDLFPRTHPAQQERL